MNTYADKVLEYLTKMQEAAGVDPNWRPKPMVAPQTAQVPQGGGLGKSAIGAAIKAGLAGGGGAAVAPMATALPATGAFAAGPSMMLPALTPMLPGAATGGAAATGAATAGTAAAPAAAGYGTLGTIGAGAAAVAAPIIFGKAIDKYFFKDKPDRKFNMEELLTPDVDNRSRIGAFIPGYDNLNTDIKSKLLNTLHENETLFLPGHASKEGETRRRVGEDIVFRALRGKMGGDPYDRNADINRPGWLPDEEKVRNLVGITEDARTRYLNSIAAIKAARAAAGGV